MPAASRTKDLGKFVSLNPAHSTQRVYHEISRQKEPMAFSALPPQMLEELQEVRGSLPTLSLLQRSYPTSGFNIYTFPKPSTYSCVTSEKVKPGNRSGSSQQEPVLV